MHFRQALPKDRKVIKKLISIYPRQLVQNHLPKTKEFCVCEVKGEVVGCCALEVYSKRLAEIRSLVVREDIQRRGIGKRLVSECLKKAKKLGVYEVLSITGSPKFFEKQGFKTFNNEKFAMLKVL